MSTPIADSTFNTPLYDYQSLIFNDQALANAGATTSAEFLLAQTIGGVQINIVAGAAGCATGVGETLEISIVTAPTSGGTFDNEIYSHTVPASQTYAAGELIASYCPPREVAEVYTKLIITSDYNAVAHEVTAYQIGNRVA